MAAHRASLAALVARCEVAGAAAHVNLCRALELAEHSRELVELATALVTSSRELRLRRQVRPAR